LFFSTPESLDERFVSPRDPDFSVWEVVLMILEVCVDSVESAIAAARGGAERVELCSALREGGITPSFGLIRTVRAAISIGVFVIIRPRGGDFVYSEREYDVMREDIRTAKSLGVEGVVFGLLTSDGFVDMERTRTLIELARPLQVTFHRAFDVSIDLERVLEQVIACGADRLLTSGGEPDAVRGTSKVARLNQLANGRIRIMAGGGIRQSNLRKLVLDSGVNEIHTSLSTQIKSVARHGNHRVPIGSRPNDSDRYLVVEEDVRKFRSALDAIHVEADKEVSVQ
jgi:copper homeostasis protein